MKFISRQVEFLEAHNIQFCQKLISYGFSRGHFGERLNSAAQGTNDPAHVINKHDMFGNERSFLTNV